MTIFSRTKVFIIGIAGFLGRHLEIFISEKQLSDSFDFIGVDIDLSHAVYSGNIHYLQCDVTDNNFLRRILIDECPEYILNLVGEFKAKSFSKLFDINVDVSRNILEILRETLSCVRNILLIGSAAEYGDVKKNPVSEDTPLRPRNYYGITKLYQTELAMFFYRNYGTPVTVARPFNIIGAGLSSKLAPGNWQQQIDAALNGDEVVVGDLNTKRDFLDVAEVVRALWNILLNGKPGEIYNVCSGKPLRLGDLLDQMIKNSGKKISIRIDHALIKSDDVHEIYGDPYKLNKLNKMMG
jgi:GDP-4-dehydro-6-deoxy-D-mannose reductase